MLEVGERPWGKYYVLEDEENYKLKRIEVNAGHRLSYQYHHHRLDGGSGRSCGCTRWRGACGEIRREHLHPTGSKTQNRKQRYRTAGFHRSADRDLFWRG